MENLAKVTNSLTEQIMKVNALTAECEAQSKQRLDTTENTLKEGQLTAQLKDLMLD